MWSGPLSVPQLSPTEVLGVGTSPADWFDRFPSADLCEPIARDAKHEDRTLQKYIEHSRLGEWVQRAKEAAEQRQKKVIDEKAAHERRMLDVKEKTSRKTAEERELDSNAANVVES